MIHFHPSDQGLNSSGPSRNRGSARAGRGRRFHSMPLRQAEAPAGAGSSCALEEQLASIAGSLQRHDAAAEEMRCSLRQLLAAAGIGRSISFDVLLVAGEAFTNAIRYGQGDSVRWKASITPEQILVEFRYASDRFETTPGEREATLTLENGRGMRLIHALTDEAHFRFQRGHVRVVLVKKLS